MPKALDSTGQRFGKLIALNRTNKRKDGRVIWNCICDCGNFCEVISSSLKSGNSTSCGCSRQANLENKRFGKLIVLNKTGRKINGSIEWKCQCDCGVTIYSSSRRLLNGRIQSCGCINSLGEQKIGIILEKNNIPFIREKTFDTCIFPDSQRRARFDFYVDNKYIIEFDGKQHFNYSGHGWDSQEKFELTQQHDLFKNNWCRENNIPLIRIPYTHLENINVQDLILKTSNFLI